MTTPEARDRSTSMSRADGGEDEVRVGDWIIDVRRYPYLFGPVQRVTKVTAWVSDPYPARIPFGDVSFSGLEDEARRLAHKVRSLIGQHQSQVFDMQARHARELAAALRPQHTEEKTS